tara:strand:+ start:328 stop:1179 length:852 start_codon:yes stop_codon:yes gene_type:complete
MPINFPAVASNLKSQARNIQGSVESLVGPNNIKQNLSKTFSDFKANPLKAAGSLFGKALRSRGLPGFGMPIQRFAPFTDVGFVGDEFDWRVRISLPSGNNFESSPYLQPLYETNGLIFPYTPQILISHSASYNAIQPIHTNYPYMAYQNSRVEQFSIVGDFFIENAREGAYWVAAVHFLRSATKMAYGATDQQGSPPPIVKVKGYGDFMFNNVPCVITQFSVELGSEVDYIQVPSPINAWCPVQSNIQVTLQPIYSRSAVEQFSLASFVGGAFNGKGADGGFI